MSRRVWAHISWTTIICNVFSPGILLLADYRTSLIRKKRHISRSLIAKTWIPPGMTWERLGEKFKHKKTGTTLLHFRLRIWYGDFRAHRSIWTLWHASWSIWSQIKKLTCSAGKYSWPKRTGSEHFSTQTTTWTSLNKLVDFLGVKNYVEFKNDTLMRVGTIKYPFMITKVHKLAHLWLLYGVAPIYWVQISHTFAS